MLIHLSPIDATIIVIYFAVVLIIGFILKRGIRTSSDFLLSKRSFSHWTTGIAFMSANLGALEVMGHTANGAKYGMRTNNWYWIGAIPAMVLLGLFMMRFYHANGVRSVPEYLRMRYDHRAHILNAFSFAIVTVLMSGINMFAFAVVFHSMLGWRFETSILLASGVVLIFVGTGGLSSSIYNEVLQFFLIVIGFLPLTFLGLHQVGGWKQLLARLPAQYGHTWQGLGQPGDPLGTPWWVVVIGIGLCASPAYWCTDFLLVQRAMAAKDLDSAMKTPLVAAVPKMLFPAIVTVQGMLALVIAPGIVTHDYNLALPVLMSHFYGKGMMGLGITALLASFMSGMSGNVTAFNTVFTYDIYQTYFVRDKSDRHYLNVGRIVTVAGTLLACLSSYIVLHFNNLMDYMQLIGILFISPFFLAFFLGMAWKRPSATAGFASMVGGLAGATLQYILYRVGVLHYTSALGADVWAAVWGFAAGLIVILLVTFLTPAPDPAKLTGLVYTKGPKRQRAVWYRTPEFYAIAITVAFIALNIIFF